MKKTETLYLVRDIYAQWQRRIVPRPSQPHEWPADLSVQASPSSNNQRFLIQRLLRPHLHPPNKADLSSLPVSPLTGYLTSRSSRT